MSELGELVVRLSMENGNVSSQIGRLKNEMKTLESGFQAASSKAGGFGTAMDAAAARANMLAGQLQAAQGITERNRQAVDGANNSLAQARTRYSEVSTQLDAATKHSAALQGKMTGLKAAMAESAKATGDNTEEYIGMSMQLDELAKEYAGAQAEVKKLTQAQKAADQSVAKAVGNLQFAQQRLDQATRAENELSQALDKANGKLRNHVASLEAAGKKLSDYGAKVRSVGQAQEQAGAALTRNVSLPLIAAGAATLMAAVNWEQSAASVRKTVNGTAEDLERLESGLLSMSKTIPTVPGELANIAANAGQLGVATQEVEGFTRAIADLKETTNLSAEQGAQDFAQFANITGMKGTAENFERLGSTVVDLGNNLATTEKDIVSMAMNIGSAGKQVGMTQATIMGVSGALASLGMEAQAGGTAVSRTLVDMQVAVETGGNKLKEYAEIAGMTGKQFAAAFKEDAAGALTAFVTGLSSGTDSAIKMLTDMGITETRQRDALLRATNASELFSSSIQRANQAWRDNTALSAEASVRYQTAGSRLQMLGNRATVAAIEFGQSLVPALEQGMDVVGMVIDKFASLDEQTRANIVQWGMLAIAAGPAISVIGKANVAIGALTTKLGGFATAMASAGGGLHGFISALGLGPAGIAAASAALLYGAYRLYDYASGAQAAREALESLSKTAQEWEQTNATTSYEKAPGLDAFGLEAGDFGHDSLGTSSWLDTVRKVWSDGKRETDAIIADNVEAFTRGSDKIRAGLKGIRDSGGMSGALGDMDKDLARLDEIDKSVGNLLKKRQNGTLTTDDLAQLQALYDEQEAIRVRYRLVADADGGFGEIVKGVEAAMSRNADAGDTWANAYAAATQGLGGFTQSLNQEYDARHKVIGAMEEGEKKQQQLGELQAWYNEQALAGARAYYAALKQSAQETGVFDKGGEYEATISQLEQVSALIDKVSKGEATEADLANALQSLDKASVVEVTTALADMQSAAQQAGQTLPANMQGILDTIESIKTAYQTTGQVFGESLTDSLKKMFGESSDQEVYEVHAALNADTLDASYDAWAAGEHADIIPSINTSGMSVDASGIVVDGLTGHVTVVTADGKTMDIQNLTLNPVTGHVEAVTADGKTLPINNLVLSPLSGHVNAVTADGKTLPITRLALNPLTGHVEAVTGDGKTLPITGLKMDPLTGTVTAITSAGESLTITIPQKDQLTGVLTLIREGANVAKPVIQLQGEVSGVTFLPDEQYSNSRRPELEYNKANADLNAGGGSFVTTSDIEALNRYAEALKQYETAKAALEGASPMDDNYEALSADMGQAQSTLDAYTLSLQSFAQNGEAVATAAQYIANGLQQLSNGALSEEDGAALQTAVESLTAILSGTDYSGVGAGLAEGMAAGLTAYGWTSDAGTVATNLEQALRGATATHSPSQMTVPIGTGIAQGVGEGMAQYGFSEAGTMAGNLEGAIKGAMPNMSSLGAKVGRDFVMSVAAGIRGGRSSVISASASIAAAAVSAAKSALQMNSPSRVGRGIGRNYAESVGLGVMDGQANVEQATRKALAPMGAGTALKGLERSLSIRVPDLMGRLEQAQNRAVGAAVAQAVGTLGHSAPVERGEQPALDIDQLKDAMRSSPLVMEINGQTLGQVMASDNARSVTQRGKRIAFGVGARTR